MKKRLHYLIASLVLLFTIQITQAQSLNSAQDFVVLTGNGAVGNTGTNTYLTGNLGAISGAVSVLINIDGTKHIDNTVATNAASDLLNAYNYFKTLSPATGTLLANINNNPTITPGIYDVISAGSIAGKLTLDGANQVNPRFVLRYSGAFNTAANTEIEMINGTTACNVFWIIDGAVDIGALTIMKGNIIVRTGAITLGDNVKLEGRALTTTGAISFTNLTATMPLGCGVAQLNGPNAPSLGANACYALFTSNGLVSNIGVGTTKVKGDIGSNLGGVIGYNQADVNGTIHTTPDASTQTSAQDLITTDTYISNLTPDIQLEFPAQFGNGLVLTPHTYYLNGGTTLTGNLTLNAQGNQDAVFVIKIDGPLSTVALAKVILVNGAQAKNVFWKVTAAVNISTLSEFKGNIISNASITFDEECKLEGSALTTSGAISTNALTVDVTSCNTTLPVSWLYFQGKLVQQNVLLEWATANETNNKHFTVESSQDGQRFEVLTTVNATSNPTAENKYSFKTTPPAGLTYYRISQTDLNGKTDYFRNIISVRTALTDGLTITHFATESNLMVQVVGAKASSGKISLYNINGQKVAEQNIALKSSTAVYQIAKPAQKGLYVLYITSEGKKLFATKVVL